MKEYNVLFCVNIYKKKLKYHGVTIEYVSSFERNVRRDILILDFAWGSL